MVGSRVKADGVVGACVCDFPVQGAIDTGAGGVAIGAAVDLKTEV